MIGSHMGCNLSTPSIFINLGVNLSNGGGVDVVRFVLIAFAGEEESWKTGVLACGPHRYWYII